MGTSSSSYSSWSTADASTFLIRGKQYLKNQKKVGCVLFLHDCVHHVMAFFNWFPIHVSRAWQLVTSALHPRTTSVKEIAVISKPNITTASNSVTQTNQPNCVR